MKNWIFILSLSIVVGCSTKNETLIFSVMGDVPRSDKEDILIQEQIELHNEISKSEFMFHVGDIKSGKAPCNEKVIIKLPVI